MAEDKGELGARLDRAVEESDVGVAQAAACNLYEHFARLRRSSCLLDTLERLARVNQTPCVPADALLHQCSHREYRSGIVAHPVCHCESVRDVSALLRT